MANNRTRPFLLLGALMTLALTGVSRQISTTASNNSEDPTQVEASQTNSGQDPHLIREDDKTVYKDEYGKTISRLAYVRILEKGGFRTERVIVDDRVSEIQLVRLTPEEAVIYRARNAEMAKEHKARMAVGAALVAGVPAPV